MEIQERIVDGVTILDLEGRVMIGTDEAHLRSKMRSLLRQDRTRIVLNFGRLSQIDSVGWA